MISVDPNWWKKLFDEFYLVTDARSVCNEELTRREVDFLLDYLQMKPGHRILDLCGGQGRHSLELTRRGFSRSTVLDYSRVLLARGRARAAREGLRVHFVRADARNTGFSEGAFDIILMMANSFGYFPDDKDNLRILAEARRLCRPRGRLLLDVMDRNYVIKRFRAFSCHRASEEVAVVRERERTDSLIRVRESILDRERGLIREGIYCERLYSDHDLNNMLRKCGFDHVTLKKNFSSHNRPGDYGFLDNRVVVTARCS